MVTSSGELKVMDFGIVKSKNQQHQATQTGELKGKLAYLAPEQIRGRRVDRRADIFTLGCVLYNISVGRGAFNPDHDQDAGLTIHRILEGVFSPPSTVLSDYPHELEEIVARALAVAPDQRFQTAEEMRRALEAFLDSGSRSVSREDVSALVQEHCGSTIEQRRAEIRLAQRMFDSGSGQMRSGAFPAASAPNNVSTPITPEAPGNADLPLDWSRSSPLPTFISGTPLKRSRKLLWGGLAVGALSLAGLVVAAARLTSPRQPDLPVAAKATDATPQLQQPVTARSPTLDPAPHGAAQPTQLPLEPPPRSSAETASKSPRKGSTVRAARVPTAPAGTGVSGSDDAAPAPAATPSIQFSQTLSRKPRHAIDESDPFGK
jgi:serine/threonine-protein kinase